MRLDNLVYNNNQLKGSRDATGIYRARVEDVKDPSGIGRVRVRVPKFHGLEGKGGLDKEGLPWATMVSQSAGYDYGSYIVPEVGEYVLVQFEDEDPYKPVYLGSLYGSGPREPKEYESDDEEWQSEKGENEVPKEGQKEIPTRKILYKSHNGAMIDIEEHKGEEQVEILDGAGQSMIFSCPYLSAYDSGEGGNSDRDITITGFDGQSVNLHSGGDGVDTMSLTMPDGDSIMMSSVDGVSITCGQASVSIDKDGNMSIDVNSFTLHSNEDIDIQSEKEIRIIGERVILGKEVIIMEGGGGGEGGYTPDTGELTPEETEALEKILEEAGIDVEAEGGLRNFLEYFYANQGDIQNIAGLKGLCNFTSYMMLAQYYNGMHLSTSELAAIAKQWCASDGFFNGQASCMSQYGFSVSGNIYGYNSIVNAIKSGIDAGNPLILHCRGFWNTNTGTQLHTTANGHFMVVRGYTANGVLVADPGKRANNSRVIPWSAIDSGSKHNDVYVRTSQRTGKRKKK